MDDIRRAMRARLTVRRTVFVDLQDGGDAPRARVWQDDTPADIDTVTWSLQQLRALPDSGPEDVALVHDYLCYALAKMGAPESAIADSIKALRPAPHATTAAENRDTLTVWPTLEASPAPHTLSAIRFSRAELAACLVALGFCEEGDADRHVETHLTPEAIDILGRNIGDALLIALRVKRASGQGQQRQPIPVGRIARAFKRWYPIAVRTYSYVRTMRKTQKRAAPLTATALRRMLIRNRILTARDARDLGDVLCDFLDLALYRDEADAGGRPLRLGRQRDFAVNCAARVTGEKPETIERALTGRNDVEQMIAALHDESTLVRELTRDAFKHL